jgi:hypothetical protein
MESPELATDFELIQGGTTFRTVLDKRTLHIHESSSIILIYVPKNSAKREICYRRVLPEKLLKIMMKERGSTAIKLDPSAVALVADILTCSEGIVDDILEDAGVIPASFPDELAVKRKSDQEMPKKQIRVRLPPNTSSEELLQERAVRLMNMFANMQPS